MDSDKAISWLFFITIILMISSQMIDIGERPFAKFISLTLIIVAFLLFGMYKDVEREELLKERNKRIDDLIKEIRELRRKK